MNHVSSALSFLSFQRLNMSLIGLVCNSAGTYMFLTNLVFFVRNVSFGQRFQFLLDLWPKREARDLQMRAEKTKFLILSRFLILSYDPYRLRFRNPIENHSGRWLKYRRTCWREPVRKKPSGASALVRLCCQKRKDTKKIYLYLLRYCCKIWVTAVNRNEKISHVFRWIVNLLFWLKKIRGKILT